MTGHESSKIRLLLVDQHEITRNGERTLLAEWPSIAIVGEASTAADGIAESRRLSPDVVMTDSSLPDASGIVVKSLTQHWSLGALGSVSSQTFRNFSLKTRFAPGIEFDFFPYSESTRRMLTLQIECHGFVDERTYVSRIGRQHLVKLDDGLRRLT